jgi:hypothetical protein
MFVCVVPCYTQSTEEPVPAWLAWRVFYQRLVHLNQQAGGVAAQRFGEQFGLAAAQTAVLLSAGQSFITALQRIDDDAVAEAKKRYPDAFPSDSSRPLISKTIPTGPRKTVRERAIADGLYGQVEARKQTLLADHLLALGRSLDSVKVEQITKYVQTSIAPRIKVVITPPSGPGTPGLPPGIRRDDPGKGK